VAGRISSNDRIMEAALRLFAERGVREVNVSDLAVAAGVARGTVYAHISSQQSLFDRVTSELVAEITARAAAHARLNSAPTLRLARAIRFFIWRAHEEPHWGRFIVRFASSESAMQTMCAEQPMRHLVDGIEAGLYDLRPEQLPSSVAMVSGSVLGAMSLVLEGGKCWREAGSDTIELVLRALGVASDEARWIAMTELPQLFPASHQRKRCG
jgi:AcrR family transcriptional regulator